MAKNKDPMPNPDRTPYFNADYLTVSKVLE